MEEKEKSSFCEQKAAKKLCQLERDRQGLNNMEAFDHATKQRTSG